MTEDEFRSLAWADPQAAAEAYAALRGRLTEVERRNLELGAMIPSLHYRLEMAESAVRVEQDIAYKRLRRAEVAEARLVYLDDALAERNAAEARAEQAESRITEVEAERAAIGFENNRHLEELAAWRNGSCVVEKCFDERKRLRRELNAAEGAVFGEAEAHVAAVERAERAEARENELRDALAAMLALSILHTDECWRGMTYWREGLDCTCGLTAARDHARALVASTEPEETPENE